MLNLVGPLYVVGEDTSKLIFLDFSAWLAVAIISLNGSGVREKRWDKQHDLLIWVKTLPNIS